MMASLALAMVLAFVSVAVGQVLGQDSKLEVLSNDITTDPAAVAQYWRANNSQNMNAAKEMTMPVLEAAARRSVLAAAAPSPSPAGPMFVMTGSAGGRAAPTRRVVLQSAVVGDQIEPTAGVFPFSFTRYRLFPNTDAEYRTYPYRTVGKLFFNIGTEPFVCSASVVTSFNFSVVWTAGHCVYTPGTGFHNNFLFAPAFRRVGVTPVSPFGDWTTRNVLVLGAWASGLLEYDHGVLVMNRSPTTGLTIGETVGMLGFMANAPREQHWHLHGYPQGPHSPPSVDPQFTGFHHEICAAQYAANDQPTGMAGIDPPTMGVGCDLTGGASGGPWVVNLNALAVSTSGGMPVALNLLNGNNSYRYLGGGPNSQRLYGPYFSAGAMVLRQAAEVIDVP